MNEYTAPDYAHAALVTIDVQCDTLDGQPLEIPGTSASLPTMVRLAEGFRAAGLPIFHVVRIYQRNGANADLCRRAAVEQGAEMFLEGSPGCEIAEALRPHASARLNPALLLHGGLQEWGRNEHVLYKPRWGAFFETPLMDALRQRKVNTLVIIGCNFPNCPRTSIYQASERDFRVVVASDAVSRLDAVGIEQLRAIGVHVHPVQDILDALVRRTAREASAR